MDRAFVIFAIFLAVLIPAAGSSAQDISQSGGFYVALDGGVRFYSKASYEDSGLKADEEYDAGYTFGGAFGYDTGEGIRSELAVSFTGNGGEFSGGGQGITIAGDFDVVTFNALGRFFYDFHHFGDFVPYIGAAAGYGRVNFDLTPGIVATNTQTNVTLTITGEETESYFIYGGILGMRFLLSDNLAVGMESSSVFYDVGDATYSYNLTGRVYYKF